MTKVVLITVQPRNPATGAATTVRLAGGGNSKGYHYNGEHWRAGVAALPRISALIDVNEDGWSGGVVPKSTGIVWAPAGRANLSALAALYWRNAAITIEEGEEETGSFAMRLTGRVADGAVQDDRLVLTIADPAEGLDRPLVAARFAGSGGAEGGAEAKERIKRRSWGRVFNIEGRVLDKANNVYEFGDPAFPWQAFDVVRDKGRDASPAPTVLAWQGSVAATLAALAASVPVQGSGVVAPSIACCKWWTQPAGPLTADVRGEIGSAYVETAPEIAARILAAASGPAITNVSTAAAWRGGAAGIHVGEDETIASVLDRLLMGVSLLWIFNPSGTVTLREFTFTGPVETLAADNAERRRTVPPIKARRLGYKRAYRKHSDGEIAASLLQLDPTAGTKLDSIDAGAARNETRIWRRAATQPATPIGNGTPSGWYRQPNPPPWTYAVSAGLTASSDGTAFTKSGGTNAWDQSFRSTAAYLNAKVCFRPKQTTKGIMVGLNSDPTTSDSFNTLDYAIFVQNNGQFYSYSNGSARNGGAAWGTYAAGDAFTAEHVPGTTTVVLTKNGVAFDTFTGVSASASLYADSSFYESGGTVEDVRFGPAAVTGYEPRWESSGEQDKDEVTYGSWSVPAPAVTFGDLPSDGAKPEDAADVTPLLTVAPDQTVLTDYNWVPLSGQLTRDLTNVLKKGAVDVSAATVWAYETSGCTITAGASGALTLNDVFADGAYIIVRATNTGKTATGKIGVARQRAAPAAGGSGSTSFSSTVSGSVTDTSYDGTPQVISSGTMRSNASGQVRLVANATNSVSGTGATRQATLTMKWRRSPMGAATWTDAGVSASGTTAVAGYYTGSPETDDYTWHPPVSGSCQTNALATGMTANTDYDFQLIAFATFSVVTTTSVGGSTSGAQS